MSDRIRTLFERQELESFHDEIGMLIPWVRRSGKYCLAHLLLQLQREVREVITEREQEERRRRGVQLSLSD